jgi:hypothetical protein
MLLRSFAVFSPTNSAEEPGFFAFAPALAEEDGGPGVTVGDGFDVDGNILSHMDILNSPIVNGLMRNLRLFVRGTSA